jgi:TatA/E family protein of Tat protein translocase
MWLLTPNLPLAFISGLSPWGIFLVLVVALLIFGNRLPEVARSMGRAINEFKGGLKDDMSVDDKDDPKLQGPKDESGTVPRDENR